MFLKVTAQGIRPTKNSIIRLYNVSPPRRPYDQSERFQCSNTELQLRRLQEKEKLLREMKDNTEEKNKQTKQKNPTKQKTRKVKTPRKVKEAEVLGLFSYSKHLMQPD
jgi:hypothetical protein